MFVGCYMCGNITTDELLRITQYGALPICGTKCLKEINASIVMPERLKAIYDQQQSEKNDPCIDCIKDLNDKFTGKCNKCENKISSLHHQAI